MALLLQGVQYTNEDVAMKKLMTLSTSPMPAHEIRCCQEIAEKFSHYVMRKIAVTWSCRCPDACQKNSKMHGG